MSTAANIQLSDFLTLFVSPMSCLQGCSSLFCLSDPNTYFICSGGNICRLQSAFFGTNNCVTYMTNNGNVDPCRSFGLKCSTSGATSGDCLLM
jgi:hypothetical protein